MAESKAHKPAFKHEKQLNSHKRTHEKTLKVKAHHAKAYRKRYYAMLVVAVVGVLGLVFYVLQYNFTAQHGVRSARNYVANLLQTRQPSQAPDSEPVSSTYGYSLTYDPLKFYGSAVDSVTGNLYVANELSTNRAYKEVKLSSTSIATSPNQVTLTLKYYPEITVTSSANPDYTSLEKNLVKAPRDQTKATYTAQSTTNVLLDGKKFIRTVWVDHVKSGLLPNLTVSFVSYVGIVGDKPLVIEANNGITSGSANTVSKDLQAIINSLRFQKPSQAIVPTSSLIAAKTTSSLNLLDKLMLTGLASAATTDQGVTAAQRDSAIYGPAVVKVYNTFCMDISLQGKPFIVDACAGVSGSAFFISQDGYLATNGHVASSSPKDIVIYDALINLTQAGDSSQFDALLSASNTSQSDPIFIGKTDNQILGIVVDRMYNIPDSQIVATNNVTNLLIDLGQAQPNIDELLKDTKARQQYPEQASIKHAKLVATDFRMIDGADGFKASDVAIMKLDGSNYPVAKLGIIDDITQGSNLNILGYPADATNNNIVDSTQSRLTLTAGKASSIKNATGSSKKLIETDTTIGHGNSGGPVLDDNGDVVGIATYTVDGSGSGGGTFNYIRDIKDLTDLASKSSVTLTTDSRTQSEWQKGMNYFYTSHYSKSIKNFNRVKQLYPQHPTVDSIIAAAQQRIKDGQDVKDFPLVLVLASAMVTISAVGVSLFLILRHKKTHNIYTTQVASGVAPPAAIGGVPQSITYDPAQYSRLGQPISSTQLYQPQPIQSQPPTSIVASTPTAEGQLVIAPPSTANQQPTLLVSSPTPIIIQPSKSSVAKSGQPTPAVTPPAPADPRSIPLAPKPPTIQSIKRGF